MREFFKVSIEKANLLEIDNMSQIRDKLKFIQRKKELQDLLLITHNHSTDTHHFSTEEEMILLNNNQVNQAAHLWDHQCQRNFWRHWKDNWAIITYAGIPKETYPNPHDAQDDYSTPLTPHQLSILDNSNPHNILRHGRDYAVDFTPNYDGWNDLRERAIMWTTRLFRHFANRPTQLRAYLKEREEEENWENAHRSPTTPKQLISSPTSLQLKHQL
jgi:hypothetical protein